MGKLLFEALTEFMQGTSQAREVQELVVRIWGMANGHAFFQSARARNLGRDGAVLSGVEHPLQAEDIIGVQYGDKKARFRVVRVKDQGLPQRVEAEVQILNGQQCPWKDLVGVETEKPAERTPTPTYGDKRQFRRIKVRFPLELRDERGGASMQTNTADASGRGCYVETLAPLPLGTKVNVTFWVESKKISASAVIRASDPGVGMGIEFVGLNEETKEWVQAHLEGSIVDFAGQGDSQ